jgi:TolA-binding protein
VAIPANRLLAWIYSRRGEDELAIQTEERMLERYAAVGDEHLASALLNKAHIRFNEKNYAAAATAYDDFVRRFPEGENNLLALYQAALSHQRLGHDGDAIDRWEKLVSIDPAAEIAEKAWIRTGDVYFRAGHYDDAKRCFQGLLEHFSESSAAGRGALHIAQCEYNAGRDAEALELYSDVMTRFPDTPYAREAEQGLEAALYRLGQREDGAEVLAQLIERFPNSPFAADAQFEIAMRSYQAEDYATAAEQFRRVVTQFTSYAAVDRAHHLMADCYVRTEDKDRARDAYEQFLFFFPSSELRSAVQFQLGSLRFEDGDYMRAAVDFTATLEEEISTETRQAALYNLALCQILLEQSDAAAATLETFRAKQAPGDPRATDVAYRLGDLHDRAGRFEEALGEYDKALASGPTEPLTVELHYRIGSCHDQLGHEEKAIEFYRKAARSEDHSDPFHVSAAVRLAALHEARGNHVGALAAYRDVIRNSTDQELVAAVKQRVEQLESVSQ